MIFNTNYYNDVNPSPYDLNMEGALMLIYETELNYNAIMKSVGVSELRYYNDTGKDLFVNEAGAFKGFIDKIKAFVNKIIEKIKSIFNKFVLIMKKNSVPNKDFIEKFKKAYTGNMNMNINYNGYTFEGLDEYIDNVDNGSIPSLVHYSYDDFVSFNNQEDIDDYINKFRGKLLNEHGNTYTLDDFKNKLHEKIYGDKKEFEANISNQLDYIKKANDDTSKNKLNGKKFTDYFNACIDRINAIIERNKKENPENANTINKDYLQAITILKSQSQDMILLYSIILSAVKDRISQAKLICVNALKMRKVKVRISKQTTESAIYNDNIFSNVNII